MAEEIALTERKAFFVGETDVANLTVVAQPFAVELGVEGEDRMFTEDGKTRTHLV